MTKKIILLLVEGQTDEDALAPIYTRLVKEHDMDFDVLRTDITADEKMTAKYIEKRIKKEVDKYLQRHPFIQKNDILKVVQIIDTDGAFIPSSQVKQSSTEKTEYFDTHIQAKNKNRLIRRNISKRAIIYHLRKAKEIAGMAYEIYYFSRNLEHVLHNISSELTDTEKEELAFKTADYYSQKPIDFLHLLFEDTFYVPGTYEETWDFIMDNGNSLKRYSNMSIFFERLGIITRQKEA